jgi:acyl dehydratase
MTVQQPLWNVGDHLPTLAKAVTREKISRFETVSRMLVSADRVVATPTNIHTDNAVAKELGLNRPVAPDQMSLAYLHELLARQFGANFLQGGELSVTFLKSICDGDVVTAHGKVSKVEQVDHRNKFSLQVWLENQEGEKISIGEAEVIVPSPLT